jgi:hypothetical protein
MPNRSEPLTLSDACIKKLRKMFNDVLENWIKILCLAEIGVPGSYLQKVKDVKNECKTMNEHLTSLQTHILDDLIPLLVDDFLNKISSHHESFLGLKGICKLTEKEHETVCTEMLKSVLGPSTRRYNTGTMSSFKQRLVIQTFPSTPNLRVLVFSTAPETDNSALLADNIHHLKHLVSFQYNYRCTDQVVEQLALHCSKLRKIDVSNSLAVTDGSVQHLLKLKDLIELDLTGTSVTEINLLKLELPNITNIKFSSPVCDK